MNFNQSGLQENELNQQESPIIDDTTRDNGNNSNQSDQAILSQQQFQKYLEKLKEIYNSILIFVEDDEFNQINFQDLLININKEQYDQNREDFKHFLLLLASIFDNHHHDEFFDKKMFQIISYYGDQIKQTFSNLEIYSIFQNNKKVLLFLIENKIIQFEKSIYEQIKTKRYCHFFYPEIKEFIGEKKGKSIENELLSNDPNIFCDFNKKRHIGENDSYISSLIRQDSVETFISYVTKNAIPLNANIKSSIFETNVFLLKRIDMTFKDISLIEYSAFFGAIQIFQYLRMNGVELTSSLWLFAIHSQNAELIHLLEYHEVNPQSIYYDEYYAPNNFEDPFIESIKCHHNNIAHYIEDNLAPLCAKKLDYSRFFSYILFNHNYEFFPNDFNDNKFYDLNRYNYNKLADLYIKKKRKKARRRN